MANFKESFDRAIAYEGFYADHPDDKGKETFMGISRRWHPGLDLWVVIDSWKNHKLFPECLKSDPILRTKVEQFYKKEFWDKISGDNIPYQEIADELFDTVINMNPRKAPEFLQRALNCLNRNQALFPDLMVDGQIGPKTLSIFSKLNIKDIELLYKMLNVLQGNHYIEEMERDHTQEAFCRGWFARVDIIKLDHPH